MGFLDSIFGGSGGGGGKGSAYGAAAGAIIGSIFPGVGTAAGAKIGAGLGGVYDTFQANKGGGAGDGGAGAQNIPYFSYGWPMNLQHRENPAFTARSGGALDSLLAMFQLQKMLDKVDGNPFAGLFGRGSEVVSPSQAAANQQFFSNQIAKNPPPAFVPSGFGGGGSVGGGGGFNPFLT